MIALLNILVVVVGVLLCKGLNKSKAKQSVEVQREAVSLVCCRRLQKEGVASLVKGGFHQKISVMQKLSNE